MYSTDKTNSENTYEYEPDVQALVQTTYRALIKRMSFFGIYPPDVP